MTRGSNAADGLIFYPDYHEEEDTGDRHKYNILYN
jgi:hypothetical protein